MRLVTDPNQELVERVLRASRRIEAPGIDEAEARERVERALARARALERREYRARAAVTLAIAAAALVALVAWQGASTDPTPRAASTDPTPRAASSTPAAAETSARASEATVALLPSGDRLTPAPGARYVVEASGEQRLVKLLGGEVGFDVATIDGGSFTVVAGDVTVRVRGTVFSVRFERSVDVEVREGVVEVERAGALVRLGRGERWSSVAFEEEGGRPIESDVRVGIASIDPGTSKRGSARELRRPARATPGSSRDDDASELLRARRLLLARDFEGALDACRSRDGADWLLLRADALRGLRRWREAAEAYDAAVIVLSDARRAQVGYAAARLWSGPLADASAALESLWSSRAARPGSSVEERARALEIELLLRLRRDPSARVREYLERFPSASMTTGAAPRPDDPGGAP